MKYGFLITLLLLSGCASNKEIKPITIQKEFAPHIWSDHKIFEGTIEMCASKASAILNSLGFLHVVKNGYFVYGNFSNNRAVIKCVSISESTFFYAAVAGPKVQLVEKLRNEIMWQL